MTATAAGFQAEAAALGISPELAEPVGYGLRELRRLSRELKDAAAAMIRAELAEHDRRLQAEAEDLLAQAQAAIPALRQAQAATQAARAKCQRTQARLEAMQAQDRSGLDDEAEELLEAQVMVAERNAQKQLAAVAAAEAEEEARDNVTGPFLAAAEVISRDRAIIAAAAEDPFSSPVGHSTVGYQAWLTFGSLAYAPVREGSPAHPEYWPAYDSLLGLLRVSGIGSDIERRVERHFEDAVSPVKHTASGIPYVPAGLTPDEALLIANRSATQRQADPVPSGPEASRWIRQDTGASLLPGIPGVSADDVR